MVKANALKLSSGSLEVLFCDSVVSQPSSFWGPLLPVVGPINHGEQGGKYVRAGIYSFRRQISQPMGVDDSKNIVTSELGCAGTWLSWVRGFPLP